jgi:cation/acetate symporter
VFGVPVGFAVIVLLSWVTRKPAEPAQRLVDFIRYPGTPP